MCTDDGWMDGWMEMHWSRTDIYVFNGIKKKKSLYSDMLPLVQSWKGSYLIDVIAVINYCFF